MAKNNALTKSTATAPEQTALASANSPDGFTLDLLGDVLGADDILGTDGLEEIERDDIKISVKVFNFKGVDANEDPIPANAFYDTVTEEIVKTIDCTLLTMHKSNEWRTFDVAADKSIIHCKSFDREIGTMADGTTRACKGCPDSEWQTGDDGKRFRNCGEVHNVVGIDRLAQSAFIIRFKRTSLDPWRLYLNKHFIGRRIVRGVRQNYPLFAFGTKLSLRMSDDRKYALPTFEVGEVRSRNEILQLGQDAEFYRERIMPALEKAESADVEKPSDTSFDPSKFGGDPGGNVLDAPGETVAAPNGF